MIFNLVRLWVIVHILIQILFAFPVPFRPAALRLRVRLERADAIPEYAEFVAYKGDDLEVLVGDFFLATGIPSFEITTFREAVRRETLLAGVVTPWKIVVCVCDSLELLEFQLLSALVTFPDADLIVVATNGFEVSKEQSHDLHTSAAEIFQGDVLLHNTLQVGPTESILIIIWDLLPRGAKIVAFCVKECELPEWPLLPATPACSRWTQFLHFTRIMWSFSGKFKAPIVAMIPDGASAKVEAGLSTFRRPSLLMFSSETVVRIGLPDANDGGIMSWIDTAWYESLLYTGHRLTTEHYLPITQGEVPHRLIASNHSSTRPRFNVLVILEGSNDSVTAHIFQDVANIVKHGIDSLGYQARITFCANLATDYCFDEEEHLIALAAHNLASFFSSDGLLAVLQGNLLPRRAVLYNFEHVPSDLTNLGAARVHGPVRDRSLISNDTLKIYGDGYQVWEYSEENYRRLSSLGIRARLVPLGYSPVLQSELRHRVYANGNGAEKSAFRNESIDVLFVGTETPGRKSMIQQMRAAGIIVVHPNAAGIEPFGDNLNEISAMSKIVLSLNAFEPTASGCNEENISCNYGEWKITRLARLLANERFVIAEMSGTANERDLYQGGIIFASSASLAETCKYYLQRPLERKAIAKRGREIYELQREVSILREPVEYMISHT